MSRAIFIAILSIASLAAGRIASRTGDAATPGGACEYALTPATQAFGANGGSGSFGVLTTSDCGWTATSNAPWLTLTASFSGSGSGRVNYAVAANPETSSRTGTVSIAGATFTVNQAGATGAGSGCAATPISPGQTINGALTTTDCRSPVRLQDGVRPFADRYAFTGTSGQPVIVSLATTAFDGYLYLLAPSGSVLAQNDDNATRGAARIPLGTGFVTLPSSGTFLIEVTSFGGGELGAYTLSLTTPPGGCIYAVSPSNPSFAAGGGNGSLNITTSASCPRTATSKSAWLTVTTGASGSGPGVVNYSVAANSGLSRTGTLVVAGLNIAIAQAGTDSACPTISSLTPPGGAPGEKVTIAGANFTGATAVLFADNVAAPFTILSDTQIAATVPAGAVNGPVIVRKANCADARSTGFTVNRPVASASAASYLAASLASESIVSAFGSGMATAVAIANSLPLPTSILGTTVKVKDSANTERLAPLFFVAPTQINYQIPPGTALGPATITVTSGDGTLSTGSLTIASVAPGLFSANSSGAGVAAATLLRVKADGTQIYEPIASFDAARNQYVPISIDFGPDAGAASDQLFLILFGTGMRSLSSLAAASCTIGNVKTEVLFVGALGGFAGLDQINLRLPRSLAGRGVVDIVFSVDGKTANTVQASTR